MRYMPLIIALLASTATHAVLLFSLTGTANEPKLNKVPIVEVGLVRHVAKELASPKNSAQSSGLDACKPANVAPDVEPHATEIKSQPAEITKEAEPAVAESGQGTAPPPPEKLLQNDLPFRESHQDHASTVPSAETAPVCTYNPPPTYPSDALSRGWEGDVLLQATLGPKGNVDAVSIAKSSSYPVLDEAAAEAVRSWQFAVPSPSHEKTPVAVSIPVQFRIRNN